MPEAPLRRESEQGPAGAETAVTAEARATIGTKAARASSLQGERPGVGDHPEGHGGDASAECRTIRQT